MLVSGWVGNIPKPFYVIYEWSLKGMARKNVLGEQNDGHKRSK